MLQTIKDWFSLIGESRGKPVLSIICLLITVTLLIAGLWPLNFRPVNKVEPLQDENGLRFYGQGIVFSQKPLVIQDSASRNASLTIELLVRPHKEIENMVASLVTLYNPNGERFILGQWKKALVIRIPALKADRHKLHREIGAENALGKDTTHLITVTSSQETTDIYVDGSLEKSFQRFPLLPEDHGFSGHLILGNSPEGTDPWNGTFFGLAIHNRALDSKEILNHYHEWKRQRQLFLPANNKPIALYLFSDHNEKMVHDHSSAHNDLLIPERFHPLHRIILGLPARAECFSRWNLMDMAINILGFVPFGFFLSARLRQMTNLPASRAYCFSILIGSCVSLAIELTQAYLPTRDSSLMDVLSNILGTIAGVLLLKHALPFLHKIKRDDTLFFE